MAAAHRSRTPRSQSSRENGVDDDGVIEILAGGLTALRPSIGAHVVAAWLFGIIVSLPSRVDYHVVAPRDFGQLDGALTMARLAGPVPRLLNLPANVYGDAS